MDAAVAQLKEAGIPAERIEEYRAAFAMFVGGAQAHTHAAAITPDALAGVLNGNFGRSYSNDDLQYMLRQFSDSGVVDFVSFARGLHAKLSDPRMGEAWGDAFDLFDAGGAGELSKDDLIRAMMHLGEKLTDAEAEEMLKVAKKKDDFVRAMSSSVGVGGGGQTQGAAQAAPAAGGVAGAPAPGGAPAAAAPGGAAVPSPGGPPRPGGGPPRPGGGPAPVPGGPAAARPGAPPAVPGPRPAGGPPRPGGPAAPGPAGGPPRPPRPA